MQHLGNFDFRIIILQIVVLPGILTAIYEWKAKNFKNQQQEKSL